jgi:hypothetical protein
LNEAFARTGKPVRLIGLGVRFATIEPEAAQMSLFSNFSNPYSNSAIIAKE